MNDKLVHEASRGEMQIFSEARPRTLALTISGLLALFAVGRSRQSTCLAAQQILPPAANLGNMPFFGARAHIQVAFDQLLPGVHSHQSLQAASKNIYYFYVYHPSIPGDHPRPQNSK